ncbi:MAG: metallopeptidase TldD-related protein [Acidobacteriota bacterium]
MLLHCTGVHWDESEIARWLEPLATRPGELAEVFGESLRETTLEWRDGEICDLAVRREEGASARWRAGSQEQLVHVPGTDEASVREAVRALRSAAGRASLPIRTSRDAPLPDEEPGTETARWIRRLIGIFARHAPRHSFRFRIRTTERRVVSPGRPASTAMRRVVSLEGRFTAASRLGDEQRPFAFHAPDSEATADELKAVLSAAAAPRDRPVPVPDGEADVVLAEGCAAVLFHEILSHALEAGADGSPLATLPQARVAVAELDVADDAGRLDLFGGYERDDEGTAPRAVRLLQSGTVGARLTDRAHAGTAGSTGHGRRSGAPEAPLPRGSNVVVGAGGATREEMARRLQNGIWIDQFRGGSADLAGGTFRLHFPRARRLRRGVLSDELGPGMIAGEVIATLRNIEPVIGRQVRACRALGWCAREGQVVPVQGEAPDVLIRRVAVRSAL